MNFFMHLALFLLIEIVFVLIIFREFPEFNLFGMVGVLHTSYWFVIVVAGVIREKYVHLVWQKFFCTYIPVVYHVAIHIYAGLFALEEMIGHTERHDEHTMTWLVIGTLGAGILIALGEYWLHRMKHCDTHHVSAHQHCHDQECEDFHKKI